MKRSTSTPATSTRSKRRRFAAKLLAASLATVTALTTLGCHRQFYRRQADQEVDCLLQEKSRHVARAPNTDLSIQPDRRSRMYNPFDLDFQPMPMDDPASQRYMQCVDGRRGYPMWDAAGFTNANENPDWWEFLPLNDDGVLVLNSESAVQVALLHSVEYQERVEDLYLAALDVSLQRFQFDTQFFGGAGAIYELDGPDAGPGGQSSRIGLADNGLSFRRAFTTGGSLVAGIANSIVWELSGPNTQSASTLLDFTLIQPLLRAAGRDVVMEDLTFAERQLLAAIRDFERFRREFYLQVTVGTSQSGNAGGLLGLLQDRLQIQNLEENVARLNESLIILEDSLIELLTTIPDNPEEVVRERLQVAQQRSALLRSQRQLVQQQASYQASVDAFMRTLGLPPYICARIEDPLLERFELIDRELRSRREDLSRVRTNVGALNIALLEESEDAIDPESGLPTKSLKWSDTVESRVREIKKELEPLKDFTDLLIAEDLPTVRQDIEKLSETLPERLEQNRKLKELYDTERENICTLLNVDKIDDSLFDVSELSTLEATLTDAYDRLTDRLQSYSNERALIEKTIDMLLETKGSDLSEIELSAIIRNDLVLRTQDLLSELGDDVLTLQLIQARARTESVLLPEVDIKPGEAFEIARRNRRDWANARAALVDAWRQIEVVADDLESGLDLQVSGGIGNDGNNPFSLRGDNTTLRMGLQWDAPLTRIIERNNYRATLIQYERAKRDLYLFDDTVWQQLRAQIRQLQTNQITFEYGRQALRIAASQIELNSDIRELRESRGLGSGATAARDTISALNDLLGAQNDLLNTFVNFEVIRRNLTFDLGVMELTSDGLWIDPGPIDPEYLLTLPGTTGEAFADNECSQCRIPIRKQPQPPNFANDFINEPELIEFNRPVESAEELPAAAPPFVEAAEE